MCAVLCLLLNISNRPIWCFWYGTPKFDFAIHSTVHVHCFIHQYMHQHLNISIFKCETTETIHSILNRDNFIILFSYICQGWSTKLKVAPYTKGFTFYKPTSRYGDLNILWKYFYLSTWLYIIIHQWSKALVLWTADPSLNPLQTFV